MIAQHTVPSGVKHHVPCRVHSNRPVRTVRRDPLARPVGTAPGRFAGKAGSSRPASDVADRLSGRRILLVEDELLLAMDVQMALEEAGADVIGPIGSLAEGLALLDREEVFDIAILDIDLHGEDVFPLAERLEARGVPFLFHTGHGDREALARRFRGTTVCIKPMLTERLVEATGELLR